MRFGPVQMKDKLGRTVVMRNAEKTWSQHILLEKKGQTLFALLGCWVWLSFPVGSAP